MAHTISLKNGTTLYKLTGRENILATINCSGAKAGNVYALESKGGGGFKLAGTSCDCGDGWELVEEIKINEIKINKIEKIMQKAKSLFTRLVDKDVKNLYEAGYLNGDLEVTEEGTKELLSFLFLANKVELVKLAVEKLEAEKEDSKK